MVDRHMGDGESACVSVCFKGSGFCYNKGSAEANADDEAIHVGPHCIRACTHNSQYPLIRKPISVDLANVGLLARRIFMA
jgi:hypothetical protein